MEGRGGYRVGVDGGEVVSRAATATERRNIKVGGVRGSGGGGGGGWESMREAVGKVLKRKDSGETKREWHQHFPGCAANQLLVWAMKVS